MNEVNKTLYIPLFGKSYVSKRGIILKDKRAEEILEKCGFALKGKSKSKWLAYYMGMRARVFDDWLAFKISENADAVVLHIGCGLDSRIERVGGAKKWLDLDFPEVIEERKLYYSESESYRMIGADIRKDEWLDKIPAASCAIVVMEGVSMYLTEDELILVISMLSDRFDRLSILMDCYTTLAARASKIRNPINDVGVTQVYGIDDPVVIERACVRFIKEHNMTPPHLINELSGMEKSVFRTAYGGKISKRLYRLYEYSK